MENMDRLCERVEALERQTHRLARQLRWWRGIACSVLGLGLLTWVLQVANAADAQSRTLADRVALLRDEVAALRDKLGHIMSATDAQGLPEVVITGANLRIVNGLGRTDCTDEQGTPIPGCPNGLGNLIVGYNEPRGSEPDRRAGSHNIVVGIRNNFSRIGGIVVGEWNEINGDFAVVSGGHENAATGRWAVISGGQKNGASGESAVVSGGQKNTASGRWAVVSGGDTNTASGESAVVSGGGGNTASEVFAVVSGGSGNTADGFAAVVSGGGRNTAKGLLASVSGGLFTMASGDFASVSGGQENTASGFEASVRRGRRSPLGVRERP